MKRGIPATTIYHNLQQVWGNDTPGYSTICCWYNNFAAETTCSLQRAEGSGRPVSVCTDTMTAMIKEMVEDDPHLTVREMAEAAQISIGSVHTILHDKLEKRCVYSTWVPYRLTPEVKRQRIECATSILELLSSLGDSKYSLYAVEDETVIYFDAPPTKAGSRVWIGKLEKRPSNVAKKLTRNKVMLAIAYTANKRISLQTFPSGCFMDADAYVDFVKETATKWGNLRTAPVNVTDLYWQHDNARCHIAATVQQYFQQRRTTLVKQSPYSPDLNMLDRWLNCKLKEELRKTVFTTDDEVATAALQWFRALPEDMLHAELLKFERHCSKVIQEKGDYITY